MYNESTARELRSNSHLELIEDIHQFRSERCLDSHLPLSSLTIDVRFIGGVLAGIFVFFLIAVFASSSAAPTSHESFEPVTTVGIMIQPGDSLESITTDHMLPSGDMDETLNWIIKKNALDAYSSLPIGLPITVPSA